MIHVKYLLVGGGVASSSAAKAIRLLDPQGRIIMVAQEPNRPYNRSVLSKQYLSDAHTIEAHFDAESHWAGFSGIEFVSGRRIERMDPNRHWAIQDDGRELSFETMLIATGASPRRLDVPGAELAGLFHLRTIDDARRLRTTIDDARRHAKPKAIIIGGGLLGVELSGTLTRLGIAVTFITMKRRLLEKYVGEAASRFVERTLSASGVHVMASTRVMSLHGDGRVQRVTTDTGETIDCDFAIAAIGVTANRRLLRNTPILSENAILTDARCSTNIPGTFAAGDCAAVFDPRFGKHRNLDHLAGAIETGKIAGTNMASGNASFDFVNRFSVALPQVEINIIGEPRLVHHHLVRATAGIDSSHFTEIGIAADGRIAAIAIVGNADPPDVCESLVRQRLPTGEKLELLKDPSINLRTLL